MSYNGWKNWDTWAVTLWLRNDLRNYEIYRFYDEEEIQELTLLDLENEFYYGDEIDWDEVDLQEVIDAMIEDIS
jgi:hypothetical protein